MEMQIKRSIEKIPGGMMLVPLFLAHCATPSRRGREIFWIIHQRDDYRYVPILAVWFFAWGRQ
ncbi:2-keto-3-deoxygluconate permease [Shigella flexneri]